MAVERADQRFRRERSVWRNGILLSLLIHLLVLLIFRTAPERLTPYAAAGPASGDPVAASGGGGMRAVVLRPPVEIKIPPKPETPIVEPVPVEMPEEPVLSLSEFDIPLPGEGKLEAPETGPGLPGGEGAGDAGNAMTGLRRLVPPTPRGVIMAPLDRPPSVRGREVTVWVFVNSAGAVDSVRLEPPTPDGKYNDSLIRNALHWVFEPAERAGRPVPSWWSYTWKL